MRILLLNGPNLNLLGTRSPEVYGATSLAEVEETCGEQAARFGHRLGTYQSNHEGDLIDAIHEARHRYDAIVFNPGAYTHTSYALHDAIEAVGIPTVEVHISNIREREPWRRVSLTGPACVYQIFGRGVSGYLSAIAHIHYRSRHTPTTVSYGSHPDHIADLRLPEVEGPHPVAVLIHGGGWTAPYTRDLMDGLAVDLAAHGHATWNIEYRRVPSAGSWRAVVEDVAHGIRAVSSLTPEYHLDPDRIRIIGHSAGAQLAVLALKQHRVAARKLILLAGILDLHRLRPDFDTELAAFLGEDIATDLDQASPIHVLPLGIPIVALHGERDDCISPEQSRHFVKAAVTAGDEARFVSLGGAGHEDIIDPQSEHHKNVLEACIS